MGKAFAKSEKNVQAQGTGHPGCGRSREGLGSSRAVARQAVGGRKERQAQVMERALEITWG